KRVADCLTSPGPALENSLSRHLPAQPHPQNTKHIPQTGRRDSSFLDLRFQSTAGPTASRFAGKIWPILTRSKPNTKPAPRSAQILGWLRLFWRVAIAIAQQFS